MNILFIGDIMGRPGREYLQEYFHYLIVHYQIDFSIANIENAAGGFGLTPEIAERLFSLGLNVLTSGNHIWDRKEIVDYIKKEKRLLRPANYPPSIPGSGSYVGTSRHGVKVGVINLSGRIFMKSLDCPFQVSKREITEVKRYTNNIIVDFHGEATSEKVAMGWYLDGEVSAVIGTHTHVQTSDERILPQGTAYITDVGMTGSFDSVIGITKEVAIKRFLTQMPIRFSVAKNDKKVSAVILTIDDYSGRALDIRRIQF
ncbi:metallophosphoesterase [bacterium (candidate division B38) B3_B38]|nr:MAG: metallophosphoesterase [bacterium (candidate division B38) B3_B38]